MRLFLLQVVTFAAGCVANELCCYALASTATLTRKVYHPHSKEYEGLLDTGYWSRSAALRPHCMVAPTTAEDVSTIIKLLAANSCQFGIRGGGHGAHPWSSSVQEGVTIDFGSMNSTSWNQETKVASIEPGAHWSNVYEALVPYGVTVAGGRAGTVGVGGFVTGGGNSFHSASHGFACDTVINFQVVLANGSILDVNRTSEPELFRALKGAGGNMGLVTRFDMASIGYDDALVPEIWGGNLAYSADAAPGVIDALVQFTDQVHEDENSSAMVYLTQQSSIGAETTLNTAVVNTRGVSCPPAFGGFLQAEGLQHNSAGKTTLLEITNGLGSAQPSGLFNIWYTTSFVNDRRPVVFAMKRFATLNDALRLAVPSEPGLSTFCVFQPITRSMVDKGLVNGGNVMGLDKYVSKGNGLLFHVTVSVTSAEAESRAAPLVAAYVKEVEAFAMAEGTLWGWKYLNYARGNQFPLETYGSEALERISAASAKYDPDGVFQRLRGSGHKIPRP